ncbi:substrate-binding periplasmic protein [Paraglaciecola sp.]|uniref:substrate-binding periplasmic protein n=1 Tax=Paraglaciecola sp. TaxID=1920173 RepID=UPI003EF29428
MSSKSFIALTILIFVVLDPVSANTLIVSVGKNKPPYVIEKGNTGFEVDVLRHVFQLMDQAVEFTYFDYGRGAGILDVREIDAVASVNQDVYPDASKLTDSYIEYHNVAISLADNNLVINRPADLAQYSVISFPLADLVLGDEFSLAMAKSPMFRKTFDHNKHPEMLIRNRVDVVVMEKQIFKYYLGQTQWKNALDKIVIHPVFPVNRYSVAFKNKAYVSSFNKALQSFLTSSDYQGLKYKYGFD